MRANTIAVRAALNGANLSELVRVQRRHGRGELPRPFRGEWARRYEHANARLDDPDYDDLTREMAALVAGASHFIGTVPEGGRPNYYQYADLRLVDWFVRPVADLDRLRRRCLEGIHGLVDDLRRFEEQFLGGCIDGHDVDVDAVQISTRIEMAAALCDQLRGLGLAPIVERQPADSVEGYARSPDRCAPLVDLTAMPLTRCHDELMFIRVLQASELCLFGIRLGVAPAIEAIKTAQLRGAAADIESAIVFATLLCATCQMLRTMPVAHFGGFRYDTGAASAIQSINYQLLDVLLCGVNEQKVQHLLRFDHLRAVVRVGHRPFMNLRDALRIIDRSRPDGAHLLDVCRQLDRLLLMWRGLHLSFAKRYIPNHGPGTGGTSGATYLRQHLLNGVFAGEQPDRDLIDRLLADDEPVVVPRIRPGLAIAP